MSLYEYVKSKSFKKKDFDESVATDDDSILASMGYKPDLARSLGAIMNFSFGFTEVGVLASLSGVYTYGLTTGGPVTMFWGWIAVGFFTMISAYSMAEICSAYPAAGSVYHWSGMIAPKEWSPLMAYITGWLNFIGNACGDASFAYSFSQLLNAGLIIEGINVNSADDDYAYAYTTDQSVGITIAVLTIWTLLNFFNVADVGVIQVFSAFVQFTTIFIVVIGLLGTYGNSLQKGGPVFRTYVNETGWSQQSYVCAIGLLTSLWSFAGFEASAHMAEETNNSRRAAPLGMINTVAATAIVGIAFILILNGSMVDVDTTLAGPTAVAPVNIFIAAAGQKFGRFLTWLLVLNIFLAGLSSVSITGRITFALLRDKAFPYADALATVDSRTKSPITALTIVYFLDAFLLLFPLFSEQAFLSITGVSIIGFQWSYGMPVLMKLLFAFDNFPVTPMYIDKTLSKILNVIAVVWLFGSACLVFFPPYHPVTYVGNQNNMNWSVVVMGGFLLIATSYWMYWAKNNFKGPRGHLEHVVDQNMKAEAEYELTKVDLTLSE